MSGRSSLQDPERKVRKRLASWTLERLSCSALAWLCEIPHWTEVILHRISEQGCQRMDCGQETAIWHGRWGKVGCSGGPLQERCGRPDETQTSSHCESRHSQHSKPSQNIIYKSHAIYLSRHIHLFLRGRRIIANAHRFLYL